jgi:hypothetical protein
MQKLLVEWKLLCEHDCLKDPRNITITGLPAETGTSPPPPPSNMYEAEVRTTATATDTGPCAAILTTQL